MVDPITVAGLTITGLNYITGERSNREQFRQARRQQALQNASLMDQAHSLLDVGRRTASSQRTSFGAAGIEGRPVSSLTYDTMFQIEKQRQSILAGVDTSLQKDSPKSAFEELVDKFGWAVAPFEFYEDLGNWWEDTWDDVSGWYQDAWDDVTDWAEDLWDDINPF